jgi:integrase
MKHDESRSFASERLAKDWASRLEAQIKLHGIPQRVVSTKSLGGLMLEYKDTVNAVKPMRRQMLWEIEQLAEEFRDVKLNQITSKRFSDFGLRRAKEGAAASTIMHNLATIRGILNAAKPVLGVEVNGKVVEDAIRALERVGAAAKSESRTRRPGDHELTALITEFTRIERHPQTLIPMATIVALAVELPRRLGELTSMLWEDYNGETLILRDTKHPTRVRTETIPVPPSAKAILDAIPKVDARILPYKTESVSAAFQRACTRLNIKDLRFHDLRHEGITRLFSKGLGIEEVSMISGHQSWAMLRRYTHISPESIVRKLSGTSGLRDFSMEL